MKRAIITGATGAIGMALIETLLQNDVEVLVFCRKDSPRRERLRAFPSVTVCDCGLEELAAVSGAGRERYDVFYHLAWAGTAGPARDDLYLQNKNVSYALDAVGAAERFGCHTFVGAGSQAEYGPVLGKLAPDTPAFPQTGYGMAKLCAGQMTRRACQKAGMKHIWARILSVYGPYDSQSAMVTSVLRKLLSGEKPALTKGEQLWDYLYSKDAARALLLLGERGKDGGVYCLGSGQERPLRSYVEQLRDIVDVQAQLGFGELPYGPGQVMELCADIDALVRDTGYVPDTPFSVGAAETAEWLRREMAKQERMG